MLRRKIMIFFRGMRCQTHTYEEFFAYDDVAKKVFEIFSCSICHNDSEEGEKTFHTSAAD